MPLRRVVIHLMCGEKKEEMDLDDERPVRQLFSSIKSQASADLQERMRQAGGPMLLLYNGQPLGNSNSNQPNDKKLSDLACWPATTSTTVPSLQLYVPKVDTVGKKGVVSSPAVAKKKDCCTIL